LDSTEENFQPGKFQSLEGRLKQLEQNIEIDSKDPIIQGGFTQIPTFILRDETLSLGAKVTYAMFLSYAWHNDRCYPGQITMAKDMGRSPSRVSEFVTELEKTKLITIKRRGQGKTNLYTVHFKVQKKREKGGEMKTSTPRLRYIEV